MVKHNNVIPNGHFRKDWQRYVKTWFDQPAKKKARRAVRAEKAKKIHPRPLSMLRPVVRGQTIKYNKKQRLGRGFTLDEIRGAGFNVKEAGSVGISVDHRRKNRCEEAFQENVERLKLYKSKLVVFPRNASSKRVKAGDATKEEQSAAVQVMTKGVLALPSQKPKLVARAITDEDRAFEARATTRKAWGDAKFWGQREKRARDAEEKAASKKKK